MRVFKVNSAVADDAFKPLTNLTRQKLHIYLTTHATDLHVSGAKHKNVIRFVKERVRCIKSETPFTKFPKRLMIEMVKQVTVLINSFNKKIKSVFINVT